MTMSQLSLAGAELNLERRLDYGHRIELYLGLSK